MQLSLTPSPVSLVASFQSPLLSSPWLLWLHRHEVIFFLQLLLLPRWIHFPRTLALGSSDLIYSEYISSDLIYSVAYLISPPGCLPGFPKCNTHNLPSFRKVESSSSFSGQNPQWFLTLLTPRSKPSVPSDSSSFVLWVKQSDHLWQLPLLFSTSS